MVATIAQVVLLTVSATSGCGYDSHGIDTDALTDAVVDSINDPDEGDDSDVEEEDTCNVDGRCSVIEQCGCEDDLWCDILDTGWCRNHMIDCTGGRGTTLDEGDECDPWYHTPSTECMPGLECMDVDFDVYRCFRWCVTDEDCAGSPGICRYPGRVANWCGWQDVLEYGYCMLE